MIQTLDADAALHKVRNLVFWYAFFMAFPVILIVQNFSIFIFVILAFNTYAITGRFVKLRYGVQIIALAFGVGAVLSVLYIPSSMPADSLSRALSVLPNYLYWVVLILFLTTHNRWIQLDAVFAGIFWGVLFSVLYYYFLQDFLTAVPIFKLLPQNTFAFLLICYTPIVVWYAWYRFGFWGGFVILTVLTLSGFLSGSRSGSVLTLSGGALTLLFTRKRIGSIYFFGLIGYLFVVSVIDTKLVRDLVFNLNQRTYNIIYDRAETLQQDRSYLVRLAQIEKSLIIFEKHPFTGIGLNNFTNYSVKLPGKFEGAEFVVHKKNMDKKSAHNSYIGFLAEGGLLLTIPFCVLLLYGIGWYLASFRKIHPAYHAIFIGLIHMSIHLYFIYAILNVFAWFLIGLACLVMVKGKL